MSELPGSRTLLTQMALKGFAPVNYYNSTTVERIVDVGGIISESNMVVGLPMSIWEPDELDLKYCLIPSSQSL